MGCKACKPLDRAGNQLLTEILKSIQSENLSNLNFFLKSFIRNSKEPQAAVMNSRLISVSHYQVNFLSYALISGSYKVFKYLYERCGCSIELMNQNFADYNMDPLNQICEKSYLELLKYFLPIYFRYHKNSEPQTNMTLDFQSNMLKEVKESYSPIQIACLSGFIAIVDYLYQFNLTQPHPLINIKEVNEDTGEDCALISIRSGCLTMVKMLNEKYNMSFNVKNKFGENALQVCAVCCSKYPGGTFAEVFVYLVEEVGLDLSENHEEILLVLEDKELVRYSEAVLKGKGIITSKKDLDDIFRTRRRTNLNNIVEHQEKKESEVKNEIQESELLSPIEHIDNETPFYSGSLLGPTSLT